VFDFSSNNLLMLKFIHECFDCSSNNLLIIKFLSMNIHFSSNKIWTSLYDFCISTEIFVFSQLLLQGWKKRELLCAYWALKVSSYNCNFKSYKSTLYNFRIMCGTKIYHYQKRLITTSLVGVKGRWYGFQFLFVFLIIMRLWRSAENEATFAHLPM